MDERRAFRGFLRREHPSRVTRRQPLRPLLDRGIGATGNDPLGKFRGERRLKGVEQMIDRLSFVCLTGGSP